MNLPLLAQALRIAADALEDRKLSAVAPEPRQQVAFAAYKRALEMYMFIKSRPVSTNEESKARWLSMNVEECKLEDARAELEASIIDEMGAP